MINRKLKTCVTLGSCCLLGAFNHAHADDAVIELGGYVKLDALLSNYADGDPGAGTIGRDFYIPGTVPVGGESESARTDFHMKETRLFIKGSRDIDGGDTITSYVEFDLLTGSDGDERISNSYKPRVRHAFVKYNNWLAGQTWTTFQNVSALAENLDFVGPAEGTVFGRQAMVRYTSGNWQFAAENPETTVTTAGGRVATDDGVMPDLVARYNFSTGRADLVVAAIARQLRYEDTAANIDSNETSVGISFSGKVGVGDANDIRFMLTSGTGLGRYLGLNTANGAYLNGDNELEAIDSTAGFVSYRHFWNEKWRSNITLSGFSADQPVGYAGTETSQSFHLNLLYSPVAPITTGVEFMTATREVNSGAEGTLNRLQFSAKYAF
ncbi:DcaP family trimeric outer membrane transporter [Marinimicrobium locisalis]|uniref:DcaP family trimeric outer membrane transporter n=1 Tax=Marinimicrobium locisalis TaxID=546022 RepID=UPI003221522D